MGGWIVGWLSKTTRWYRGHNAVISGFYKIGARNFVDYLLSSNNLVCCRQWSNKLAHNCVKQRNASKNIADSIGASNGIFAMPAD